MDDQGELLFIKEILKNNKLKGYVQENLKSSLTGIGFSKEFVYYLTENLSDINPDITINKFNAELVKVFDEGFFQNIVPTYFEKKVIPHIPSSNLIIDIGCGTGILDYKLSKKEEFKKIIGIDLDEYPEWNLFRGNKVSFKIIREREFEVFINENKPDNIILTWTLHHMDYDSQQVYLKKLYDNIKEGAEIIVLEDAYSIKEKPEEDVGVYDNFMKWNEEERKKIMSVYDWIANRILARRKKVPIPFAYITLEEWKKLCKEIGFTIVYKRFIGFPSKRDINTPQSLIVVKK